MTDAEIEEQLRELLWSYRKYYLSDLDDGSLTMDEQTQVKKQSKIAWDTLKAAFGSRSELTKEYLKDSSPGAEEKIQLQLKMWANELQWPKGSPYSGWLESADTVEECHAKTEQSLAGGLWPFIKVISSQVLKSGVILADLPGFHDSNNARVKAAEVYMYECDEIFVVADIGRVGTNKNVQTILEKSLGRNLTSGRPSQGIALVCTKSEDLDEDDIRNNFFVESLSENAAKLMLLDRIVQDSEISDTEGGIRRRDQAQEQLDYLYMTTRNNHIEKLVHDTYGNMLGSHPLSVFCVSNKAYKKLRRQVRIRDLPMRGSGIPALRKHCHKIPAQTQFRIGHHFLTVSLKSLVQQVQLWLVGGSQDTMPNEAAIQKLLRMVQDDLKITASEAICAARDTQYGTLSNVIIQPMGKNLETWTEDALKVIKGWTKYHPSQILRFCQCYGSWGSAKVAFTEWNQDLIKSMVDDMSPWWDLYAEMSNASAANLEILIFGLLNRLISQVKDFEGAPLFAESLATKNASIKCIFQNAKDDNLKKMNSIKYDASDASQNHQSSYTYQEMRSSYEACMQDSVIEHGDGATARRRARLQQAIGSDHHPILFSAIQSRLQNDLRKLSADTTEILDRKIGEIFRQIGETIGMLRGTEAKVLANNGHFLKRLENVATEIVRELEDIVEIVTQVTKEAEEHGYC